MIDSDAVTAVLAKVSRKPHEAIQPHLSLGTLGLSSSFGLSAVRSLIEAAGGAKLAPLTVRMTVAEVISLATHSAAEGVATVPPPPVQKPRALASSASDTTDQVSLARMGLGLDMQEIDALPTVVDYRADPFYVEHFLPSEIATAILHVDPRAHLCGVFCAKEAAKKSHPALTGRRMSEFQIVHDDSGRPKLLLVGEAEADGPFTFILSITHTGHYAAATCLTFER